MNCPVAILDQIRDDHFFDAQKSRSWWLCVSKYPLVNEQKTMENHNF